MSPAIDKDDKYDQWSKVDSDMSLITKKMLKHLK